MVADSTDICRSGEQLDLRAFAPVMAVQAGLQGPAPDGLLGHGRLGGGDWPAAATLRAAEGGGPARPEATTANHCLVPMASRCWGRTASR